MQTKYYQGFHLVNATLLKDDILLHFKNINENKEFSISYGNILCCNDINNVDFNNLYNKIDFAKVFENVPFAFNKITCMRAPQTFISLQNYHCLVDEAKKYI